MVKGKKVQNTFVSPPHKDNYIWGDESQIIFYVGYQKPLFDGYYVEIYGISPCPSPN